ncbi:MAG: hypothetical protein A3J66_02190 [Candidatus Magasanikbacteria bacterium RIFCSPHIGHO2_02_FULL_47_14]|uniref:Uncharacterized protein n=1 Tax=Candidatus Magasanikbacteria bacterium RIFCSPHIGHO2_02_FULL_47_14 TaxID=1798680 RepID=A0A1F6M1C2_9BACT|nr:MAG: hypothetical protein A3J66_02190 [Candidatus Magasanikbacteria bacterium RIFCSPHIGHO2_02_FULL_47_14]
MQHAKPDQERWHTLSLCEQLGNVGSEVGRALNWQKKQNKILANAARERALELLDLTASDARWHGLRKQEIIRVREVVCDFWWGGNQYGSTPENLEKYFLYFAFAARAKKEA